MKFDQKFGKFGVRFFDVRKVRCSGFSGSFQHYSVSNIPNVVQPQANKIECSFHMQVFEVIKIRLNVATVVIFTI